MMRVLVLGGSGNFGARIVRALQREPTMQVLCAGRRCTAVPGAPAVPLFPLDLRAPDLTARFRELTPALVIHCAGPFQGQEYAVARAAIGAGAHYLDLADGRAFVAGFRAQLDELARQAGVVALTGVSTLPALSSAVIDTLRAGLTHLTAIHVVIAPGQRAPRGAATLAGVFSYLGQPFEVWQNGRWETAWGWMGLERVDLAVGRRLAAWCDVPDLQLLAEHYPGVQSVTFKAALEFAPQHVALALLAGLRRSGMPVPITRCVPLLQRLAGCWDRFAGRLGGMRVRVTGADSAGRPVSRDWQVIADADQGPEIPCMAAIVLAGKIAQGRLPAIGARPCLSELSLDEFSPQFQRWNMQTQILGQP
jgi:hypothetical protein